jgi:hypothetical protein
MVFSIICYLLGVVGVKGLEVEEEESLRPCICLSPSCAVQKSTKQKNRELRILGSLNGSESHSCFLPVLGFYKTSSSLRRTGHHQDWCVRGAAAFLPG